MGLWGELDPLLENYPCKWILLLRGILDRKERAYQELTAEFSHPLCRKYSQFFVCADEKLVDVGEEYPFILDSQVNFRYAGFIGPDIDQTAIEEIRKKRLDQHQEKKKCDVVSAGAGTFHSQNLPEIVNIVQVTLDASWVIDVVTGPYSKTEKMKIRKNTSCRFSKFVHNLPEWHFASDLLVTPGGSNTILEGIFGGAWVIPVPNKSADEIRIFSAGIVQMGLCDAPIDINDLPDKLLNSERRPARYLGRLNMYGREYIVDYLKNQQTNR